MKKRDAAPVSVLINLQRKEGCDLWEMISSSCFKTSSALGRSEGSVRVIHSTRDFKNWTLEYFLRSSQIPSSEEKVDDYESYLEEGSLIDVTEQINIHRKWIVRNRI